MQTIISGYDQLFELSSAKIEIELHRQSELYSKEMSENRTLYAKQLAYFQVKIDILEKEKADLRYISGQNIIKIRELERFIDEMRKSDKSNMRGGMKINTLKHTQLTFENTKENNTDITSTQTIPDKLIEDITNKLKKLHDIKAKINEKKEILKEIELEISDKQCNLATVAFEIELTHNLIKPIAKYIPKVNLNFGIINNKEKKNIQNAIKDNKNEDDYIPCHNFFKYLAEKSKDRLIHKGKISQDHIFQSISVIYNRAIVQVNIASEGFDFQYLVYKQFVRNDNKAKSEKSLKVFLGGCLRYSEFRRVSVLLRFLSLGALISKHNFSSNTLQVYLSLFFFMQNSKIGLLMHKDTKNPIQYYPLSRILSCIKELKALFPEKIKTIIELYISKATIADPKQINPQGLIELEGFFEIVSETHENIYQGIAINCEKLFKTVTEKLILSIEQFKKILLVINPSEFLE